MKAIIVSFALAIVLCGQAMAQEPFPPSGGPDHGVSFSTMNLSVMGPPGMPPGGERGWWKDPNLVRKLHLSDDQVQKIEKISQNHQTQEIDLRADLEKKDATLQFQMEVDPPDEAEVLAQIDKVTQARARLEKSHVELMLAVRHVLTTEQARMLRDLRSNAAPPALGFGPPDGDRGGPPEGGPAAPSGGPPEPPQGGNPN